MSYPDRWVLGRFGTLDTTLADVTTWHAANPDMVAGIRSLALVIRDWALLAAGNVTERR